ncbi:orotidine-5'-phosphate decarboxylase [Candidatus Berkelbacteria bacterium]|nr:orotidine-5'-phosphate decarboxylase [Candidatus Berkelbacteria bacterium]
MESRLIVAIDGLGIEESLDLAETLCQVPGVWGVKFNDLLRRAGCQLVLSELRDRLSSARVMVDLKLHDIPNTVANDCKALAKLGADIVTVHASGGREMIRAAVEAIGDSGWVIGITALTSLTVDDCDRIYRRRPDHLVSTLLREAQAGGAAGIVCSPQELDMLNQQSIPERRLLRITPGIRPAGGGTADDQRRVGTPQYAIERGAHFLVVGRPITGADNPVEAARTIVAEIEAARVPA